MINTYIVILHYTLSCKEQFVLGNKRKETEVYYDIKNIIHDIE